MDWSRVKAWFRSEGGGSETSSALWSGLWARLRGSGRGQPLCQVAAFGKHPGWDDHIEDLGMQTDLLVRVKRWLYVQGIGRNIDTGTWDKLADGERLGQFGHLFAWRLGRSTVVGRVWASSDGKGRSRYPMVGCVEVDQDDLREVLDQAVPALASLQQRSEGTADAAQVREAVASTQASLMKALWSSRDSGEASTGAGAGSSDEGPVEALLAPLQTDPALGEGREGLRRILYQIGHEFSAYRQRRGGRSSDGYMPTGHLRVPVLEGASYGGLACWLAMLEELLGTSAPLLAVVPDNGTWVDLIVGEPESQHFYCMLAQPATLPLTSDIPFNFDKQASTEVDGMVAELGLKETS